MKAIVIGATSGVGRALSELLSIKKMPLTIVSSDLDEIKRLAGHLKLLYQNEVDYISSDAKDPHQFSSVIAEKIITDNINLIFLPIGASSDSDDGLSFVGNGNNILNINFLSIYHLITLILPQLSNIKNIRIVGFGSIAASRGRNKNIMYSCAKSALQIYFQSLRKLLTPLDGIAQFYILGYIKSRQTFGKKLAFSAIPSSKVARKVIGNLDNDFGECFYPTRWAYIVFTIKILPWWIFKRLKY